MTIITEDQELGFVSSIQQPETTADISPDTADIFAAAFRQENSLVSWASSGFSLGQEFIPDPSYDPFNDIQGYEQFADSFTESTSMQQTELIKMQIGKELKDRETLASGGVASFAAMMSAGITDPIYLPLMFTGLGAVKGGASAGKVFAQSAAIGAGSEVPAELAKHGSQEVRTGEESAIAIGGSALFSGIIGTGINSLTKGQFDKLGKQMDEVLSDPSPRSVGAAQVSVLSDGDLEVVGEGIVSKFKVSPLVRLLTSQSRASRLTANELMESPIVIKGAEEGKTAIPSGGSVETRVKMYDAPLVESLDDLDSAYKTYREGMGDAKRIVNDVLLRNQSGKLSPSEFRVEVGKAMRRGDEHAIPEVAKAAKSFRAKVFDPAKDRAIEEGLLPPDIDVSTATSYLTRIYTHKKIIAKRDVWDKKLTDWFDRGRSGNLAKLQAKEIAGEKPSISLREQAYLSDAEIKEAVDSITSNILGNSSGRVPYNIKATVKGPLNERVLNIPDEMIEEFLESDIDLVARQYTMTMAPDIELTARFGDINMTAELDAINAEYKALIDKATTEKQRISLEKQQNQEVKDLSAVRDMLRGTHRVPEDPNEFFVRAGRTLRDVNFLRMLGGMTISAIPDLARPIATNGLMPVARGLKALATSPSTFNISRKEAKKMAVGLDMVLNSRATSMADVADIYARGSAFERGLKAGGDVFGKMTLMTQWNASMKQFSGVVIQDRVLADVVKWGNGTLKKAGIKRLASSGIDENGAKRIADQFEKYGDGGSLNLSNAHLWDDSTAREVFSAAILKDVDRTILTPGVGEKPLWTTGEAGKLVFQFKTFASAAHHKILIADLQYHDAAALNGFLMSVALGTLTYGLKQYTAGRPIETDSTKLIVESLDRSGAFGYFWDVNNMIEKGTRGNFGVNPMVGGAPMSRYASRNMVGAMLGPSFGTGMDVFNVTGAVSSGEFSASDIHTMRKLLPGQNLFYMRRLLNELENKVSETVQ
jgi:hypothetical protein